MKSANTLSEFLTERIRAVGGMMVLFMLPLTLHGVTFADSAQVESIDTTVENRGVLRQMQDVGITFRVNNMISADEAVNEKAEINVTTVNGIVLLTGSVKNAEDKQWCEDTALRHPNVLKVVNELRVRKHRRFGEIIRDKTLQISVKARLTTKLGDEAPTVHVVTYGRIVYLMGVVSKSVADKASEIASNTSRVERVITIFQFKEEVSDAAS